MINEYEEMHYWAAYLNLGSLVLWGLYGAQNIYMVIAVRYVMQPLIHSLLTTGQSVRLLCNQGRADKR